MGQPITYVVNPEHLRTLLKDEAHKLVRDDAMTRALEPALGAGLLTSDGHVWQAQRRVVAPAFRPERVRTFIPALVGAAERTLKRWQDGSREIIVDLQSEMMRTAFDAIIGTIISDEEGLTQHANCGRTSFTPVSTEADKAAMLALLSVYGRGNVINLLALSAIRIGQTIRGCQLCFLHQVEARRRLCLPFPRYLT